MKIKGKIPPEKSPYRLIKIDSGETRWDIYLTIWVNLQSDDKYNMSQYNAYCLLPGTVYVGSNSRLFRSGTIWWHCLFDDPKTDHEECRKLPSKYPLVLSIISIYIVLIKKTPPNKPCHIHAYGKTTKFLVIIFESPALLPRRKPLINSWCEICNV